MFHKKITFVVGAGASAELGLPVGGSLKGKIADLLYDPRKDKSFLHAIVEAAKAGEGSVEQLIFESKKIAEAMDQAPSIDEYLDFNQSNEMAVLCGKLAISRCILDAEDESLISFRNMTEKRFDFAKIRNTWYYHFQQMLFRGARPGSLEDIFSNVSMITFNYDRCLEHFTRYTTQSMFGLSDKKAEELARASDTWSDSFA